MIWIVIGVILASVAAFVYWRIRARRQHRLISFVALVREPVSFDPVVLARLAGKTWKADLGDGASEGADGFVVGVGVINTISHAGRMFLVMVLHRPQGGPGRRIYHRGGPESAAEAEELTGACLLMEAGRPDSVRSLKRKAGVDLVRTTRTKKIDGSLHPLGTALPAAEALTQLERRLRL